MCIKNLTLEEYLQGIYQQWEANERMYQNLRGFDFECPPIPWFGNINRRFSIVSLEPLMTNNYQQQVEIAIQGFQQWQDFFMTSAYFQNLYPNGLSRYWKKVAHFLRGFLNLNNPLLINVLEDSLCEFPFIQYHALRHPNYPVTEAMVEDLITRFCLGTINNDLRIVYFNGRSKWHSIFSHLQNMGYDIHLLQENVYGDERSKTDIYRLKCAKLGTVFLVIAPQFGYHRHLTYPLIEQRGSALRLLLNAIG